MIVVGSPTLNASTNKVELVAPMGFGTARGVRLSNFTTDSLILTNISGVDQSQEYLAPQTQMVYPTANIGATPIVVGTSEVPSLIVEYLQVEWSTDPDNDFIGTYPAALPVPIVSQATTGREIYSSVGAISTGTFASPFTVQVNDYSAVVIKLQWQAPVLPTWFYQWTDDKGNLLDAGQLNSGKSTLGSSGTVKVGMEFTLEVRGYYLQLMTSSPFTITNVLVTGLINVNLPEPIQVRNTPLAPLTAALATGVNVGALVFSLSGIAAAGLQYPIPIGVSPGNVGGVYTAAVIGSGMYTLQTNQFPTDTVFTISLSRNGTTGLDDGTGYLLCTSSDMDVVTVGTKKVLSKSIYLPPWFALYNGSAANIQSGIVVDVITASAAAYNLYVTMMPENGGSAGIS